MRKKQLNLFGPGQGVRTLPRPTDDELRGLIARVHPDFRPVWDGLPENQQLALAAYFLPRKSLCRAKCSAFAVGKSSTRLGTVVNADMRAPFFTILRPCK